MKTLEDLRQTISRFVDGRCRRMQLRRELDQLAAMGSLDAVLADAGLVRSQIEPLIAGGAGSRELLDQMLARVGVDAAQLPAESMRDMTWTCTTCPDKRQCREWLSGTEETGFRTFCPNAEQIDYALAAATPAEWRHRALRETGAANEGAYRPTADELRRMSAEASRRETRALLDRAHVF